MPFHELSPELFARNFLQKALQEGRQSHAYLFAGPGQEEAKATAIALAQALLCPDRKEFPFDACGHCQACTQVEALSHPDLHWLRPEGQTIKIDGIRRLRTALSRASVAGKGHVVVLEKAHRLGREAANALLKTLEEPTGQATFILLSSRPSSLLRTIASRLQKLYFPQDPNRLKTMDTETQLKALIAQEDLEQGESEESIFEAALIMRRDLFQILTSMERIRPEAIASFTSGLRRQDSLLQLAIRLTKSFYSDLFSLAFGYPGPFRHAESPDVFQRRPLSHPLLQDILADCDDALLRQSAHVDGEQCLFLLLTKISRRIQVGSS